MELFIVRHAWAGDYGDPQWPDDTLRPVTEKGKKRFADMAKLLVEHGVMPQIVVTSPMLRCRQTAEILAKAVPSSPEIIERDELLPGGDIVSLLAWTTQQAKEFEQIAWVGHSPEVGEFTAALIGTAEAGVHFAKGAAACIRFDEEIGPAHGELRWLVSAKMLGC